ncbi:putative Glutathione S-transferase omega-1 [Hypsibius exemplaris]|uniref:Glutathione S-transferase omega-1 n=1 Tax=Hypsibius exemplaris TaxID=2072580 RepID=A0A1W0XE14_HYPEX|nr:putative Glutathione S-transferase omega-1 [Hypsibius exemplaris]
MAVITDDYSANTSASSRPVLDPTLPTLYSTRMSPYCQRVRLLLNAKEIPFQVVNINIWDKPKWFLGVTPLNKVPTAVEPNGRVTFESLIMAQYLDEEYRAGTKQFLPSDPYAKARELLQIERIIAIVADPIRDASLESK